MPDQALTDLRVVDISQGIAGPYATKLLADSGATVTKVEPPAGDYSRRLGPFPNDLPDPEKSGLYLHLNTSKRSITLDVSVASGQVVLKKLLANADVFVCGEKTSTLQSWGLSYDDLKDDYPDLVVAQVSPFGATGPYADYEGNSLTAMAISSIMYNTGDPDREPLTTGGEPAEYIAGVHLWIGILAAIENRAAHGGGDHVDVSIAEAAAVSDEYNAAMYAFQGAVRRRQRPAHRRPSRRARLLRDRRHKGRSDEDSRRPVQDERNAAARFAAAHARRSQQERARRRSRLRAGRPGSAQRSRRHMNQNE